jgi:hypothetical protein
MKPSSVILFVSLAANLALLTVFLPSRMPTSDARSASAASNANSGKKSADSSTNIIRPSLATRSLHSASTSSLWSVLATDDLDTLAARLRAAGFNYRQARAVIFALAETKFSAAHSVLRDRADQPYWKPAAYFNSEDPKKRVQEMQLSQQESAFYRKYLNSPEALAEDGEEADAMRQRYGNLPLDKLQSLARIQGDYDDLQQKIYAALSTRIPRDLTPDDRKQLSLLASERERDIRQALTPEEFNEYLLRESPTAQSLRNSLGLLRLTETEYKALFAFQRSVDLQFSPSDHDKSAIAARAEAIKNLQPQIIAALGPDRYADYKQLMESGSDSLTRLMTRLDLPLSNVGKINSVRDDINQRATAIRSDTALSASDRAARLVTLAQEAQTRLTTTLGGPIGYEAYADMKGEWLRNLTKP